MAASVYDMITIGGPAGLTAGLDAGCARFQTLLLAKPIIAGQIRITDLFNNYPGFPDSVSGYDLPQRQSD
jgi:thioredoxin reductase (NADPH)